MRLVVVAGTSVVIIFLGLFLLDVLSRRQWNRVYGRAGETPPVLTDLSRMAAEDNSTRQQNRAAPPGAARAGLPTTRPPPPAAPSLARVVGTARAAAAADAPTALKRMSGTSSLSASQRLLSTLSRQLIGLPHARARSPSPPSAGEAYTSSPAAAPFASRRKPLGDDRARESVGPSSPSPPTLQLEARVRVAAPNPAPVSKRGREGGREAATDPAGAGVRQKVRWRRSTSPDTSHEGVASTSRRREQAADGSETTSRRREHAADGSETTLRRREHAADGAETTSRRPTSRRPASSRPEQRPEHAASGNSEERPRHNSRRRHTPGNQGNPGAEHPAANRDSPPAGLSPLHAPPAGPSAGRAGDREATPVRLLAPLEC